MAAMSSTGASVCSYRCLALATSSGAHSFLGTTRSPNKKSAGKTGAACRMATAASARADDPGDDDEHKDGGDQADDRQRGHAAIAKARRQRRRLAPLGLILLGHRDPGWNSHRTNI